MPVGAFGEAVVAAVVAVVPDEVVDAEVVGVFVVVVELLNVLKMILF